MRNVIGFLCLKTISNLEGVPISYFHLSALPPGVIFVDKPTKSQVICHTWNFLGVSIGCGCVSGFLPESRLKLCVMKEFLEK